MAQTEMKFQRFLSRNNTTLLRGVCMVLIVFSHTANEFIGVLANYHIGGILLCGQFSTGLFFFLSGYGLTLSIKRNDINRNYLSKHIRKLLVPYLVFWLFYLFAGLLYGSFPTHSNLFLEFLSLKMPNADTWFFRTILAIYILYFSLARFLKPYAGICMTVIIVLYVSVLVYYNVPAWWWNTISCFPVGILYGSRSNLCKQIPAAGLFALGVLFVILYKFCPVEPVGAIGAPIVLCLFCAYLSSRFVLPESVPVLSFIGMNSLQMYFMEAIPIDYVVSSEAGFVVYVMGGIIATIALTYLGVFVEKHIG